MAVETLFLELSERDGARCPADAQEPEALLVEITPLFLFLLERRLDDDEAPDEPLDPRGVQFQIGVELVEESVQRESGA